MEGICFCIMVKVRNFTFPPLIKLNFPRVPHCADNLKRGLLLNKIVIFILLFEKSVFTTWYIMQ